MPPTEVAPNLLSWGSEVEDGTIRQAARAARLPVVTGHVALMPDAHIGIGATVGSVIPTSDAIIPAAVGVDLGCGVIATEFDLTASDLPENLDAIMSKVEERIPAGVGKGHTKELRDFDQDLGAHTTGFTDKQQKTALQQFGSLGSGNHFVEICLDERDRVWTVLHSGSRGIGNQLAMGHIKIAKALAKAWHLGLEDPDLAYFIKDTPEFDAYIRDMLWAQKYALGNRRAMAAAMNMTLVEAVYAKWGHQSHYKAKLGPVTKQINCHHNFTQLEQHGGRPLWITRKGAIKADKGDLGVIPGSMGTRSYVVEGLGNTASYYSCAHGAGRRMSRTKARETLTAASLTEAMGDRKWNSDRAKNLVDEHPLAYKDVDKIMEDQRDLVKVLHTLRQVFNYKG